MSGLITGTLAVVMASALSAGLRACSKNSDTLIKHADEVIQPSTGARVIRQGSRAIQNNDEENQQ